MRTRLTLALLVCCLLAFFSPQPASAQNDKDLAEIHAYVLTMDNVKRMYVTMNQLKEASEKDASLKKSMANDSDDDKGDKSLATIAAKLSAYPAVVLIMANNGFTPRQFLVAEFAVIQSGFATAAIKMGAPREKLISEGAVSAANLDFVQQHQAELDELGKKYPIQ